MSHAHSSSSSAKVKPNPGDKVFVGGSPEDRKVFIKDIIDCIQTKGSKTLLITISDLSEYLHKQPALSPSNLFRKQYGNLEHVFAYEHLPTIFTIENSVIRLQPVEILKTALAANHIPQDLFDRCVEMHRIKRVHDLTTLKTVGKNECKKCHQSYSTLANTGTNCNGGKHEPSYNFELSEDVLKCAI